MKVPQHAEVVALRLETCPDCEGAGCDRCRGKGELVVATLGVPGPVWKPSRR